VTRPRRRLVGLGFGQRRDQGGVVVGGDRGLTPIDMSARKVASRLEKGQRAVEHIAEGRFPPSPDPVICPRCPFFFVCPAVPSGRLVLAASEAKADDEASTSR